MEARRQGLHRIPALTRGGGGFRPQCLRRRRVRLHAQSLLEQDEVYGDNGFVASYPSIPSVLAGQQLAAVGFEVSYCTIGMSEITFLELHIERETGDGSSSDIASSVDTTLRSDNDCIRADLAAPQLLDPYTSVGAYIGVNAPDAANRVELSHVTYYFEVNPASTAPVPAAARGASEDGADTTGSSR